MSVCKMDDSPWCSPGTCVHCDAARRPAERPHTFVHGKFKAGERGHQMPDETCDVCGRDPRNMIHEVKHNLTDEELLRAAGEHARLTKLNERAYVLPETIELARLASAAANEVIAARRRERRLLEWTDQLDANRDKPGDVGKFIAAELRNRMVGR